MVVFSRMKNVKFKGIKMAVPYWTTYLTIDAFGEVEAWSEKPELENGAWRASEDVEMLNVGWCEGSVEFEPECNKV